MGMPGDEFQLILETDSAVLVRTIQGASPLGAEGRRGKAAEEATQDAATRWGMPDFVYRPLEITKLAEAGHPPIEGLTNHSLRRTFASLLYEAGASPAYVMAQMGHTSASMALEVYAKKMMSSAGGGDPRPGRCFRPTRRAA